MFHVKQAFSTSFLNELVQNTLNNFQKGNMIIDQFHFANYAFIQDNIDVFKDVLIEVLKKNKLEPDISADDLIYVNDFSAVVNIDDNVSYKWHWDLIDRNVTPRSCYNLWIPIFNEYDKPHYDQKPLLSMIPFEHGGQHDIYNVDPWKLMSITKPTTKISEQEKQWHQSFSIGDHTCLQDGKEICKYIDKDSGKLTFAPLENYKQSHAKLGDYGDCTVFCANQYHKTGQSLFPRFGIAIKFAVKERFQLRTNVVGASPDFLSSASEMSWLSLFTSSAVHNKTTDLDSWKQQLKATIKNKSNAETIALRRKDIFLIAHYLRSCIESHGGEAPAVNLLSMLKMFETFNPEHFLAPCQS